MSELNLGYVIVDLNKFKFKQDDLFVVLNNNEFFETNEFANITKNNKLFDLWNVVKRKNKITIGNYKWNI